MKQELIQALIEKPSVYEIDVLDNSMLPDKLKKRTSLSFTVKPPTIEVLANCADIIMQVPQEVREKQDLALDEAAKYVTEMAGVVCVLAHPKGTPPKWYLPFIKANLTPKELFMLFKEASMKTQADFFLASFQNASLANPMTINDLTPTNS